MAGDFKNTGEPVRESKRFVVLLIALGLLMVAAPLVNALSPDEDATLSRIAIALVLSWMLLSAVFAISARRRTLVISLVLAIPAIVLGLLRIGLPHPFVLMGADFFGICYLLYVEVVTISLMFKWERVTVDNICAALCVYLLMAVMWSNAYSLMTLLEPGSFALNIASDEAAAMSVGSANSVYPLYFSFVTMTTLGYGDITPVSATAKMMAVSEAVVGQLYLTVVVARLVALHITNTVNRRDEVNTQN